MPGNFIFESPAEPTNIYVRAGSTAGDPAAAAIQPEGGVKDVFEHASALEILRGLIGFGSDPAGLAAIAYAISNSAIAGPSSLTFSGLFEGEHSFDGGSFSWRFEFEFDGSDGLGDPAAPGSPDQLRPRSRRAARRSAPYNLITFGAVVHGTALSDRIVLGSNVTNVFGGDGNDVHHIRPGRHRRRAAHGVPRRAGRA